MEFCLTRAQLREHLGYDYFERAARYFKQGRVLGAPTLINDRLSGRVQGSDDRPYTTEIRFNKKGITGSSCSCPVRAACKHVGALGLESIAHFSEIDHVEHAYGRRPIKIVKPIAAEKKPTVPGWIKRLDRAVAQVGRAQAYSGPAGSVILVFRLHTPKKYLHLSQEQQYAELQIRPCFIDAQTGESSMTAIRWADVEERYGPDMLADHMVPDKARKFLGLLAGFINQPAVYYQQRSDWLAITDSHASMLWKVLQHHEEYDVPLVFDEKAHLPLAVKTEPAMITIGVRDNEISDGIILAKEIVIEGLELEKGNTHLLLFGEPRCFSFVTGMVRDPDQGLRLYCGLHPVGGKENTALLLAFDKPVVVPAADFSTFNKQYAPALVRKAELRNYSSRIVLPVALEPKLVIRITKQATHRIGVAIYWQYGEAKIEIAQVEPISVKDSAVVVSRNVEAEQQIQNSIYRTVRLHDDGQLVSSMFMLGGSFQLEKMHAAQFLNLIVPELEHLPGVEVIKDAVMPNFELLEHLPEAHMSVNESASGEQADWFDLRLHITVGGQQVTLAELLPALRADEEFLFLENGNRVHLRQDFFEKLKILLEQAAQLPEGAGAQSNTIPVSRFQAGWWEELKELGIVGDQAALWQETIDGLLNMKAIPQITEAPKGLQADLRPYQQEGLAWLHFLREQQLGGVLADDMGLGKTVQSIALICLAQHDKKASIRSKKSEPFLIIAPTSVVENWDNELQRFAPHLATVVLRSGDRSRAHKQLASADVVVTSFALLHRDEKQLQKIAWDTLMIDEAQMVKNHQSKAYALIRKLSARSRFALTGTPMENNTMELWSLFSIVAPGLFPPPERFKEHFQRPIEKQANTKVLEQLRRRVRPFMLRRKKELVEKDLPKKIEQVVLLEMATDQRKIYDLYLHKQRQRVLGLLATGGFKDHRFEILTALTRMRQLCLHPQLVDIQYGRTSSVKLDALMEQLTPIIGEKHKVLVYSQFTSFLALARKRLEAAGIPYCYLDGTTKNRKGEVATFQSEAGPQVFLISLKAGGVGLNLTAADYCILLDPWWNPAVEQQAMSRAHRIGQKRTVVVYKFIVKNSIEEKVLKLQEKKKKLFENVIEEGDAFGSLITEEDIRGLLD